MDRTKEKEEGKIMYEQVAGFIKEIGFPIGVAIYLLIYFGKVLKENTKSVGKNTEVLTELATLVRNLNSHNKDKKR